MLSLTSSLDLSRSDSVLGASSVVGLTGVTVDEGSKVRIVSFSALSIETYVPLARGPSLLSSSIASVGFRPLELVLISSAR